MGSQEDWTVIKRGDPHPLSGYQTSIARVGSEVGSLTLFNSVVALISGPTQWLFPEPRYSVLVGREDSQDVTGVARAKTFAKAEAEMERIDKILAPLSREDARSVLSLDS